MMLSEVIRQQQSILAQLESTLASGGDVDVPTERVKPTDAQIVAEIEQGPLAEKLAPYWQNVFKPDYQEPPKPDDPKLIANWEIQHAVWKAKMSRAGWITDDAAFAICKALADSGRLDELGWNLDYKAVRNAQRAPIKATRRAV